MKLAVAILLLLCAVPAGAQKMVVCTKPDGTKYAGFEPPEGCVDNKAAASATPTPALSSEHAESARAYCAGEWPDSPGMQKSCSEKQMNALAWLADMGKANEGNEKYGAVVERCRTEFRKNDTWDWEVVRHCIEKEISTYEQIQDQKQP